MSIERDITHHGTGVLAWCAWNERRERRASHRQDSWRLYDIIWVAKDGTLRRITAVGGSSLPYTVTGPAGDVHHYQPHVGPM